MPPFSVFEQLNLSKEKEVTNLHPKGRSPSVVTIKSRAIKCISGRCARIGIWDYKDKPIKSPAALTPAAAAIAPAEQAEHTVMRCEESS